MFKLANPHALASIVDASITRRIVASQDIFDDRGTKLWARDQPVSHSLQQRLLERKLKQPLEACLRADDGITTYSLHEALTSFIESDHPLAKAVLPWADRLREEVRRLPLHAAVQLLLTASQATKPQVFDHAVRGMALAGAIQASVKNDHYDVRFAMLGGLLHDLGEMYVNPQYLDGSQRLDIRGFRHVVTHPRIGELLLASMTDYPPALARAIGEHHERLDGTGYPMRRGRGFLSPLGGLLAVTETALAISGAATMPMTRTSFALRMVAGEFDEDWVGFISSAASRAREDVESAAPCTADELSVHLALMDTELDAATEKAQALASKPNASPLVKEVAAKASERIHRLRAGWNSIGLWSVAQSDASPQSLFEQTMAKDEMRYRMKCIERDCLWHHQELNANDAAQLSALWGS